MKWFNILQEISPEHKRSKNTAEGDKDSVPMKFKGSKKVMVYDTCYSHSDNNVNKDDGNSTDERVDNGKHLEETVFVVPETLAMDTDYDDDEAEGSIVTDKFAPVLSTIDELSCTSESESMGKKNAENGEGGMKERKVDKDDRDLALTKESFSLIDVLENSKEDDTDADNSLYEAISDIGASIVEDSDHETNKSVSGVRSKSDGKTNTEVSDRTHPLGGRCRNMAEVNEMFETPEGKTNTEVEKQQNVVPNKKRLFKTFSETNSILEEQVLRRSPRKLKGSKLRTNTSSSELCEGGIERPQKILKCNINENLTDNDITIAPEFDDRNCSAENQSMDLYNVVPVKNGEPIKGKQFQMRVKKNKPDTKGKMEEKIQHNTDGEIDCQSPLYNTDKKIKTRSKVTEVIPISSPSVSSLSDPDSPLLLKTKKTDEKEIKGKLDTGKDCSAQCNSKSNTHKPSPSKVNNARSDTCQMTFKRHKKKEHQNTVKDSQAEKLCGNSPNSKRLRQSTLTQRFFSPNKKHAKVFESNDKKQDAKVSAPFQQMMKTDDEVIFTGDSPPFKRPSDPLGKEYLSARRKGKKHLEHLGVY